MKIYFYYTFIGFCLLNNLSGAKRLYPFDLQGKSMIKHTSNIVRAISSNSLEKIDVLNDFGLRTNEVLTRQEVHRLGKLHRAVHLYLFDYNGNILLQRRSNSVDHYPNMFSISLTGHVGAGEGSMLALEREIEEELHMDPKKMNAKFLFSFRRDAILSSDYIDRQFNDVYVSFHDFQLNDIIPEKKEIKELQLVPIVEFKKMIDEKNEELAPVYGESCKDVLYFLDNRNRIPRARS